MVTSAKNSASESEAAAAAGHAVAPWIAVQRDALLQQRGHAWLLHGPSGLGQFALAMELVRAWLCDAPTPHGACGHCASCHAIDVHAHTDLCVLMPETQMLALGWPLPEKAQAEIDDKKRKPSQEIRVDAMRDAVEFTQRTSGRGKGKAVLNLRRNKERGRVGQRKRLNHDARPLLPQRQLMQRKEWMLSLLCFEKMCQ